MSALRFRLNLQWLLLVIAAPVLLGCAAAASTTPAAVVTPALDSPAPTQTIALATQVIVLPASPTPAVATSTAVPPAPVDGPAKVIASGSLQAKTVALTFDAGADRGFAEQILDTLARENVIATFGLTGQWAEKNA